MKNLNEIHIIFGTGPVGCWIAQSLVQLNVSVRAINRSGKRPALMPADVEIIAADASNEEEATTAAANATVIYQALNPPYHLWHKYFPTLQSGALAAAKATGARCVSIENLYMYDSSNPINENSPIKPRSEKGKLRQRMADGVMEKHNKGEIQATSLRSSDYFGPGVRRSALGEMVFGTLVSGKKAQIGGAANIPHSFAYIEDVGKAAALLGTHMEALGKIWIAPHAPALTQGEMIKKACTILGIESKFSVISPFMMRLAGLFVPAARASVEMMYEFTEPFIVDSNQFQKNFNMQATPIDEALERTISWYKASYRTA